jgi:hypothetical protein
MDKITRVITAPISQTVLAVILAACAFSGRLSASASETSLLAAWFLIALGLRKQRWPVVATGGIVAAVLLIILGRWLVHTPISPIDQEIKEQQEFRTEERWRHELEANPAGLIARPGPATPSPCGPEYVTIVLGTMAESVRQLPITPIKVRGKKLLVLDKDFKGDVNVTFDLKDRNGNLLARADRNVITIPPQHAFLVPRHDLYSLGIWDERGNPVLNIDYADKNTIKITGEFDAEEHHISITDQGLWLDGQPWISNLGFCWENPGEGAILAIGKGKE